MLLRSTNPVLNEWIGGLPILAETERAISLPVQCDCPCPDEYDDGSTNYYEFPQLLNAAIVQACGPIFHDYLPPS
jgi:hypothetical protein